MNTQSAAGPCRAGRGDLEADSGALVNGGKPTASFVMAGLRPGHPRLSHINSSQDVDARHKAGHDGIQNRSFESNASRSYSMPSPKPGAAAALAFHHLVALLEQALAFAVFTLRLLLDVGASFIGHDSLPAVIFVHSHEGRILDYKQGLFDKAYSK